MATASSDGGTAAAAPVARAADYGWSGQVRMPDLWDALTEPNTVVTFGRVVRARYETRDPEYRDEARAAETALRRTFGRQQGSIERTFYCDNIVGGCALTEKQERIGRRTVQTRTLHTVINNAIPEIVALESQCVALAEDAVTAFCGRPALLRQLRVATDMVFSVMTRLLRAADEMATTPPPTDSRRVELIRAAADEYAQASLHINAIIQREARFTYFQGVLGGTALDFAACALLGWLGATYWSATVSVPGLVGAVVFGALGALASVFQRISAGQLVLDFTVSRWQLLGLGSLRPFVGSIFGAVVYLGLVAGLVGAGTARASAPGAFGLASIAGFAAGFSERLATDMIERAGRLIVADAPAVRGEQRASRVARRTAR